MEENPRRKDMGDVEHQASGSNVPRPGEWPVGPQEAQVVSKDRIWVDGCFDFSHHGVFNVKSLVAPFD